MADYATLLRDHTTLTCRCIDRIFLQGYVEHLQTPGQVCGFLHRRGYPIPSSAAFGKIGERYVQEIHRWAEAEGVQVHHFAKGEDKEEFVRPLFEAAAKEAGEGRVVLLGIAQEKASCWRSWVAKGQEKTGHPHMEWGRQMAFVNHFYFYIWDREWGKTFWKTNAYAPYPVWLYLNGHEWAKQQLTHAGIDFKALDNGFRSCADAEALQMVCDSLGPTDVARFFWRWFWRLPTPFTRDDVEAGYTYALAFRQFEVSDTRVFDRPQAGRAFFEGMIRDHLDLGRPKQVMLIFDRRITSRTPGRFKTTVITEGVDAQISCTYKSSKIKQYFKEHRALRTETTINNTHDFAVGRSVCASNWSALLRVGDDANQRLCDAQAADAKPAPDAATVALVTRPSVTEDGLRASALAFGDPRVMALFAAIVRFAHLFAGFRNAELVELMGALLDAPYTSRQATYDLRRLRRKGLIARTNGSHRYQLTPLGRRVMILFGKVHGRVLASALPLLEPSLPDEVRERTPLAITWRSFERELDRFAERQMIAA